MANKPKQTTPRDRRAKLEELRRQQAARERRKTLLFVGLAGLLALGIVAAAAVPVIDRYLDDPARKPITAFGVGAAEAGCDPVQTDPQSGSGAHVEEGTRVKYDQVPPSSGQHLGNVAPFDRKFYTDDNRPSMEALVHNLEHGYTVVWYDDTVKGQARDTLRDLATKLGKQRSTQYVIVSAWDDSYGTFPAGKHVAMSHWGARSGYRQLCAQVSGEAIEKFVKEHPKADSPEPNAP